MVITIAGKSGSGKGTLASLLSKKLHYPYYSVGGMRRAIAKERGMTMEEFNRIGERQSYTDRMADRRAQRLGRIHPNLIMEGRMAWYFMPKSIKVFLDVTLREAARRIHADRTEIRKHDSHATTLRERIAVLRRREASDRFRFKKHYGVDPYDRKKFDIVINTSPLTPQQVLQKVLDYIRKQQQSKPSSAKNVILAKNKQKYVSVENRGRNGTRMLIRP